MISAYFDESAEERFGHGILAVAGYVFADNGIVGLEQEWGRLLKKYKLPYFHMSECNADCPKPENVFHHLTKNERIQAATEAIAVARKYPLHGAAYVVRQEDYREILEDGGFACDAYSFLLWTSLLQVSKWCTANVPEESLSLFFESGYKTQSRASELLEFVIQDKIVWRNKGRPPVIGHSFFNKDSSYPGQAADLLAWNVRKGNASEFEGKPIRGDTLALIQDRQIYTVHYPRDRLIAIRNHFIEKSGTLKQAAQILFAPTEQFLGGS